MSDMKISIPGGESKRLLTGGKYCPSDIVVTAEGEKNPIDLTKDTVSPDTVFKDITFHGADGKAKTGTFTITSELAEQDTLIAQIKSALSGKAGGGAGLPTQEKTVEITENGEYEVVPDTRYTLSKVAVSVDVPIPDGYIVPSGTVEITENGSYDVTDKVSVLVDVENEPIVESLEITENGTYTAPEGVDGYSPIVVNVPTGGETQVYGFLDNTITAIDSDVKSVAAYACRGLSKIKTVNVPNATSIGTYAFYYCTALTSINAPNVTSLGTYAFYNSAIKSINFPLATSVPSQCFYSCSSLTKADFGAAKSIAASAFAYAGLNTLILRRTAEICTLANKNALIDTPIENGTCYIYVPAALVDTYKAASNWSTYANQFRAIEDYPDICG